MNNSQNKKQYNLESIETNTSFDQEHIGNNIVNILRNYSEERKISQIESPNVKKTGPVDKKNIDSTMSFLLTKNNVNQTIEVNASLNNRTSETLNFNLHNNINSSPTTTFPVGNHNNSSDTLSYKIRDNMKRSFSKANDDIDETELDLIETVITRIFNGRNDLVLLVEIFKRDESYKNLEAALNLVTSKNTEDHVKYYNGNYFLSIFLKKNLF
uniref:Dynein light chain n=1 Tax=Strongyloides papillosus TaxID=174720 RepID=A0A0N5C7V1_STREA